MDLNKVKSVSVWKSGSIVVISLLILLLSYIIDFSIIVERPNIGDISTLVRGLFMSISSLIGLFSGLITIYNWAAGEQSVEDSGPTDSFVVEGDLHFILGDPTYTQPKQIEPEYTEDVGEEYDGSREEDNATC